jgi:MoxR-like ATPase
LVIEGHESMKEFDLLGGYVPEGKDKIIWHDGVLVQAMRSGSFLFIDEANRMPTRTLNVLLGVLSRGAVVLTEHGSEEVVAQPAFQVVMAMNLGRGYAVNTLDEALLNRFPITLEYRYLPPKEEVELLVAETGLSREVAETMVKVAEETRAKRKNHELLGEITPRGLIAWAQKLKGKSGELATLLQHTAKVTWMHAVAGVDADGYLRDDLVAELYILIESHAPRGVK